MILKSFRICFRDRVICHLTPSQPRSPDPPIPEGNTGVDMSALTVKLLWQCSMNRINIYSLSQSEKFKNSDNPYKSIFASQSGKIVVWLDIFSLFVMPSQWVIKRLFIPFLCPEKKRDIFVATIAFLPRPNHDETRNKYEWQIWSLSTLPALSHRFWTVIKWDTDRHTRKEWDTPWDKYGISNPGEIECALINFPY